MCMSVARALRAKAEEGVSLCNTFTCAPSILYAPQSPPSPSSSSRSIRVKPFTRNFDFIRDCGAEKGGNMRGRKARVQRRAREQMNGQNVRGIENVDKRLRAEQSNARAVFAQPRDRCVFGTLLLCIDWVPGRSCQPRASTTHFVVLT